MDTTGGRGVGGRTQRTCVRPAVVELDSDSDADSDVESVEGSDGGGGTLIEEGATQRSTEDVFLYRLKKKMEEHKMKV